MSSRAEETQFRKTENQQSGNTQNSSEVKNDTQNNDEGYDHKQENHDDGKHEINEQEGSNDEHDNNEGKEKLEKDGSQQKSGGGEPGDGNDGREHPKVSNEALRGSQSPAPRKKYDFEEAMEEGKPVPDDSGKDETGDFKAKEDQSSGPNAKLSQHKNGGVLRHMKDGIHHIASNIREYVKAFRQ